MHRPGDSLPGILVVLHFYYDPPASAGLRDPPGPGHPRRSRRCVTDLNHGQPVSSVHALVAPVAAPGVRGGVGMGVGGCLGPVRRGPRGEGAVADAAVAKAKEVASHMNQKRVWPGVPNR